MRRTAQRGQASIEAVSIMSFFMMGLLVTTVFFAVRTATILDDNDERTLLQVARVIQSEIELARQAEPGFVRTFTIPERVGGRPLEFQMIPATSPQSQESQIALFFPDVGDDPGIVYSALGFNVYGSLDYGENSVRVTQYGILIQPMTQRDDMTPRVANARILPGEPTLLDIVECRFDIVDAMPDDRFSLTWTYYPPGTDPLASSGEMVYSTVGTLSEIMMSDYRYIFLPYYSQHGKEIAAEGSP